MEKFSPPGKVEMKLCSSACFGGHPVKRRTTNKSFDAEKSDLGETLYKHVGDGQLKILVPSSCSAVWKTRCPKEQQYDQTSPERGESNSMPRTVRHEEGQSSLSG